MTSKIFSRKESDSSYAATIRSSNAYVTINDFEGMIKSGMADVT